MLPFKINQTSPKKMSERQTKAGNQITLSLFHTLTLVILNNFCSHVYAQKSLSHSHTLTLSHSHTLTLSHSLTLTLSHSLTLTLSHSDTLAFSHSRTLTLSHSLIHSLSRHAEQLLFSCLGSKVTVYSRKLQCFFLPHHHPLL